MKRSSLILGFSALLFTSAMCQHSSNSYNKLGDSLYARHHFLHAAKYYEKALKNAPDAGAIMIKLARSFGKLNETDKSAQWYGAAKNNRAVFSNDDIYQYAQVLAMGEQRSAAEAVLQELIEKDRYARKEREFLDDLLNFEKYYRDSSRYNVRSLSINTSVAEFAPAYYKDGIVYASATPENAVKPKYHWDNSHFLNLLRSKIIDNKFQQPSFFEHDLNTKYHDGPAVFYNNFNSMIVNRNQKGTIRNAQGRDVWHMALLDAKYIPASDSWQVEPLPFDEAPYSFLHPHISEDGTTLYFVSDKPGGYGGTDIYRSMRVNGTWTEPFNLGPTINSSDNEVFPFMEGTTLYFASRGHGGLGGLDIYSAERTINGFAPPENLGSPINSSKDDFSFIVSKDQRTGYLSSSRNGNDDLFSFEKTIARIPVMAHTFDGATRVPLDGASVQVISATAEDLALTADSLGNFSFTLPESTAYIIVVSKQEKVGMHMGTVGSITDPAVTQQVPAFSDTTTIPCVGIINDKNGVAIKAKNITVRDETTKKEIGRLQNSDVINFTGEKNHRYRIEIENENGDTTVQIIHVEPTSRLPKTWTMTLEDAAKPLTMAARIFNAANDQPLSNANVEIITFSQSNLQLTADVDGRVDFTLPYGTTFLLIGSNSDHSGMLSGVAEKGQDKTAIIHPVPAFGDQDTLQTKFLMALVTDENGDIVQDPVIAVRDKHTGDSIPAKISQGLLYFKGEIGKSYTIAVDHNDFDPFGEEITITEETEQVEKISVVLKRNQETTHLPFALRVFKDSDKSNISGATVTIISSSAGDHELVTDINGFAEYSLEEGSAYMVIARKGDLVGNFTGTAGKESTKEYVVNPVPAFSEITAQNAVVAKVVDANGNLISTANTTVSKRSSGETVPTQTNAGLLHFMGESGEEYTITVKDENYGTIIRNMSVNDSKTDGIMQLDLLMEKPRHAESDYRMNVQIVKANDHSPLADAKIVVITFSEDDQEFKANKDGLASLAVSDGSTYMIVGSKDGYVGMLAGTAEKGKDSPDDIHIIEASAEDKKTVPVITQLFDSHGKEIEVAEVSVREKSSQKEINTKFIRGMLTFAGEKGKQYDVTVEREGKTTTHIHTVLEDAGLFEKLTIIIPAGGPDKGRESGSPTSSSPFNKNLIVFQTDERRPKVYLNDNNSFGEVIERENQLYLQKGDSTTLLGPGKLSNISSEKEILGQLKLTEGDIISLQNIYFEFNKSELDANAKLELEKVNYVLTNFPDLQLVISAHADDRGQDIYNLTLSKRRAKAVASFLVKSGIARDRITQEAMGETLPEVPCLTRECTEEEHQKNRRAEFVLRGTTQFADPKLASTQNDSTSHVNKSLS
ncbi:MAG TPA: OmpA family protein [Chryseolinea sp.]